MLSQSPWRLRPQDDEFVHLVCLFAVVDVSARGLPGVSRPRSALGAVTSPPANVVVVEREAWGRPEDVVGSPYGQRSLSALGVNGLSLVSDLS